MCEINLYIIATMIVLLIGGAFLYAFDETVELIVRVIKYILNKTVNLIK